MKQESSVIYVWFAENDGVERNGEQFIRAWTHDPARVEGLRNAIGKEPTIYSAILQAATREAPSADAVVQILKDEQQWLASSRDNCDEDELQRWDRIQVVIDYVAPKGDGND